MVMGHSLLVKQVTLLAKLLYADLPCLMYIKSILGGSVKARSGVNAYRWRLHNTPGMMVLINCINGHIRHSARVAQLHRVCSTLFIAPIMPSVIITTNA